MRDVLGRPTQITVGSLVTTIAYDTARRWVSYGNAEGIDTVFVDGDGRVVNQVAVRNNIAYQLRATFDSAGRRQTLNAVSPLWSGPRTLHFGYDAIDRQTFVEDFAGKGTSVAYNRDSRPQTITLPTSATPSARLRQTFTYGANDRLSGVTANSGADVLNWSYGYDALSRMTSAEQGADGFSTRRVVGYDLSGRVGNWTDTQYSPGLPYTVCEDPTQIRGEGCMTFYPVDATPLRTESYTYDAVGNRTDLGASVQTGNRLAGFNGYAMTYDNDGNLLTKSGNGISQSFAWNDLGQLASVTTNGMTSSFGYDGLGRRVRKTTNGVSTYFLYDGDDLVMQLAGTGHPQLEFSYYPGVDHPHAVRNASTGAIYYYATTQPGNVTALVNATGQVVNRYEYTPFGQPILATEQIPQPFRYTARHLDSETGLYYYRARYYDPALARFISEDPIGLVSGVNQYAYASNDPVNYRDPSGLCVTTTTDVLLNTYEGNALVASEKIGEIVTYSPDCGGSTDSGGGGLGSDNTLNFCPKKMTIAQCDAMVKKATKQLMNSKKNVCAATGRYADSLFNQGQVQYDRSAKDYAYVNADPNPQRATTGASVPPIYLGPPSFKSIRELRNSISHEVMHLKVDSTGLPKYDVKGGPADQRGSLCAK